MSKIVCISFVSSGFVVCKDDAVVVVVMELLFAEDNAELVAADEAELAGMEGSPEVVLSEPVFLVVLELLLVENDADTVAADEAELSGMGGYEVLPAEPVGAVVWPVWSVKELVNCEIVDTIVVVVGWLIVDPIICCVVFAVSSLDPVVLPLVVSRVVVLLAFRILNISM
jgi:hypothetical protein